MVAIVGTNERYFLQDNDLRTMHDHRKLICKSIDILLSILREISYAISLITKKIFGDTKNYNHSEGEDKIEWSSNSKGLCVFLHGLRGHPAIWDKQIQLLKKNSEAASFDRFVPYVPKGGNCALEEAAIPILQRIEQYTQQHPERPVCLMGVSNGSRLATYIEVQLRTRRQKTPVKVSTIAGVHHGSPLIKTLEKIGLARFFLKDVIRTELAFGSKKSQELFEQVIKPMDNNVAARDYEFFASTEDFFYVSNLHSSLPRLDKGEKHYVYHGHGHNSIVAAVAQQQITSCIAWLSSYQTT